MKRKDKEQMKAMSAAEMASEIKKKTDELFRMNFGQIGGAKNPLLKRTLGREIAMLKTWIHEKEMSGAAK